MSEENKPALIQEPTTDFTEKDMQNIQEYIAAGLPDIATVDGEKMARMMDLYLSGKTYRQIAMTVSVNKRIVLYLSHKFNWFALRMDYIKDLEESIRGRMIEAKLVNQDFLLQLIHMWQKKIGNKITKYLATDNEQFAKDIDLKEVDKYLKTVEMLHKLSSEKGGNAGGTPAVGLNLGDGVTIERKGDNTVEITPKSKAIGDMLKQFADSRREEESVPKKK